MVYLSGDVASNWSYFSFDVILDEVVENLLCEFGVLIMDGVIGFIDDEGVEIFVEYNVLLFLFWMSNGNLCGFVASNDYEFEWVLGGGVYGVYVYVLVVIDFGVLGYIEVEFIVFLCG